MVGPNRPTDSVPIDSDQPTLDKSPEFSKRSLSAQIICEDDQQRNVEQLEAPRTKIGKSSMSPPTAAIATPQVTTTCENQKDSGISTNDENQIHSSPKPAAKSQIETTIAPSCGIESLPNSEIGVSDAKKQPSVDAAIHSDKNLPAELLRDSKNAETAQAAIGISESAGATRNELGAAATASASYSSTLLRSSVAATIYEDEDFGEIIDDEDQVSELDDEEVVRIDDALNQPHSVIPKRILSEKEARRKLHTQRMLFFVSQLSEEQLNQYECFRRATFPKPLIKKHISATTKCKNISQNVLIVLSGITKVLIGQIIDEAITLSELSGDCLPLKPLYIRSAYSNLLTRGEIPELLQDRNFNFE